MRVTQAVEYVTWRHARGRLEIGDEPLLMGIINVTPDSFSDGGCFAEPEAAVEHGVRLAAEGAALLDVGGESTRPGAAPVPAEEEKRRVLPVIRELVRRVPQAVISVDTYKAEVAAAAVEAGASIINDVGAALWDPGMVDVLRQTGAGYICMHSRARPDVMQDCPHYDDVTRTVRDFLRQRQESLRQAGVEEERMTLDVGIGFGKTPAHNLELIAHAAAFRVLGRPMVWGLSRKSFIVKTLGLAPEDSRLPGGLAAHAALLQAGGAQIWRVHDVAETAEFVRMWHRIHQTRTR